MGDFAVIIIVLGNEAKVFLSCKNTWNTLSQREWHFVSDKVTKCNDIYCWSVTNWNSSRKQFIKQQKMNYIRQKWKVDEWLIATIHWVITWLLEGYPQKWIDE